MKGLSYLLLLSAAGILILSASFSACTSKEYPAFDPSLPESPLYLAQVEDFTIDSYKHLAILPPIIALNTRNPGTGRASKRTEVAREHRKDWMQFNYDLFSKHASELKVKVQKPDSTLTLLHRAGISIDSLPFFSRLRLMNVLQVDALFMHDMDINIYSSTGQDVAEAAGLLLVLGAGGRSGVIPHGDFQPSNYYTVEFYKLYGKGINTPIWIHYGTSNYKGKAPPGMPRKTSLAFYRSTHFPLLKPTRSVVFDPE